MMEIDLFTRDGELVVKVLVLPYQIPPEVIAWGERVFVRREDGKYYEGFVALASGEVKEAETTKIGERQTCPRRAEGHGWGVENEDLWDTSNWRYTDVEQARKANQEETRKKNEEAKAKGWNSTSYCNERYWLWPGPGEKPRTCSFCGCINPEDALYLKKNHRFTVERSTKGYKVYMHPPGYEIGILEAHVNMDAGVDPVTALSGNRVEDIAPPLKAYSPHFTVEQWKELIS